MFLSKKRKVHQDQEEKDHSKEPRERAWAPTRKRPTANLKDLKRKMGAPPLQEKRRKDGQKKLRGEFPPLIKNKNHRIDVNTCSSSTERGSTYPKRKKEGKNEDT